MDSTQTRTLSILLRVALAFAFLYPPVAAFFAPDNWIWFVPDVVETFMPTAVFLQLFGALEVVVAVGILFMRDPTIPAIAACIILAAIILYDFSVFDITFRDVSILLSGVALILLHRWNMPKVVETNNDA